MYLFCVDKSSHLLSMMKICAKQRFVSLCCVIIAINGYHQFIGQCHSEYAQCGMTLQQHKMMVPVCISSCASELVSLNFPTCLET